MMMTVRPLTGFRIALSIGESDDLKSRGITRSSINRLTISLTSALLAKGAPLAFGHDWRQEGVMEAVCRGALDAFGYPGEEDPRPLVLNLVPWPDLTQVRREVLTRMPGVLSIQQGGLPPDLKELGERYNNGDIDSETQRYLRARGLTHLRQRLVQESYARICLGGRDKNFQGRYPGILEETLFTLDAGQPLYLIGLLGGATFHLGRAILMGERRPEGFGGAVYRGSGEDRRPLASIYQDWSRKYLFAGDMQSTFGLDEETLDLEAAWNLACELGTTRLSLNRLSLEENLRLLETDSEEEVLHLVLVGLLRIASTSGIQEPL